jgi:hypothetical protein
VFRSLWERALIPIRISLDRLLCGTFRRELGIVLYNIDEIRTAALILAAMGEFMGSIYCMYVWTYYT